jgi:hypothetical protein
MTSKFAPLREYRTKPLTAGSSSTTSIFCTVRPDVVASGPVSETYKGEGPIASGRILLRRGAVWSDRGSSDSCALDKRTHPPYIPPSMQGAL